MKTECMQNGFDIQGFEPKRMVAKKDGHGESSDDALILLMLLEKKYHIISRFSHCFKDLRNPERIMHPLERLLKQRMYGSCQGYEEVSRKRPMYYHDDLAILRDEQDLRLSDNSVS